MCPASAIFTILFLLAAGVLSQGLRGPHRDVSPKQLKEVYETRYTKDKMQIFFRFTWS
uniref:Uncharacterized protein n=1 Tax=Candidozyma auris TaxID=498019 RepID=A0A0L0NRT0_CANAR